MSHPFDIGFVLNAAALTKKELRSMFCRGALINFQVTFSVKM